MAMMDAYDRSPRQPEETGRLDRLGETNEISGGQQAAANETAYDALFAEPTVQTDIDDDAPGVVVRRDGQREAYDTEDEGYDARDKTDSETQIGGDGPKKPPTPPHGRGAAGEAGEPEDNSSPKENGVRERVAHWMSKRVPQWVRRSDSPTTDQTPGRPYERKDMVLDPRTGETVPEMQLLDDAHLAARSKELTDQANDPRPEPMPIPPEDVPQAAFDLLMSLQDVVVGDDWQVTEKVIEGGQTLRTFHTTTPSDDYPDKKVFFTAQLTYGNHDSATPEYGNLAITDPMGFGPREFYFQASPAPREPGDTPLIYFDDYPFMSQAKGQPERNTRFAQDQALRMIAKVMNR